MNEAVIWSNTHNRGERVIYTSFSKKSRVV